MDVVLTEIEARILGSLVEKQLTTPEYYPLSLNALTAACNQKNNREPVMELSEQDVTHALDMMRQRGLAFQLSTAMGRVPKYEHNLVRFGFDAAETALVCVLLLRGAQTPGELRGRTSRIHTFASVEEVEQVLTTLSTREDGPYVVQLPRRPGERECRYMHLFFGQPDMTTETATVSERSDASVASAGAMVTPTATGTHETRIVQLEHEVEALRTEMNGLKEQFEQFRRQFE